MSITLPDIAAATEAYIENEVDVRINRVTGNLEADEEGTYTVRVTNAAEPTGLRLTDMTLHITIEPRSVARLIPPTGVLINARATGDRDDPLLGNDDRVDEMFVFFLPPGGGFQPDSTLDPGEVSEVELRYQALAPGDATIRCHVHAEVEIEDLFPRSAGSNGEQTLTVRS